MSETFKSKRKLFSSLALKKKMIFVFFNDIRDHIKIIFGLKRREKKSLLSNDNNIYIFFLFTQLHAAQLYGPSITGAMVKIDQTVPSRKLCVMTHAE